MKKIHALLFEAPVTILRVRTEGCLDFLLHIEKRSNKASDSPGPTRPQICLTEAACNDSWNFTQKNTPCRVNMIAQKLIIHKPTSRIYLTELFTQVHTMYTAALLFWQKIKNIINIWIL